MTLSFAERRAQTRTLVNVSFWLNPQSRSFDLSGPRATTIEDFEKLCGSIQDARFDADFANDFLNSALDLAEGFLVEYATVKNRKVADFKLRVDYSLVSLMPGGDPGRELELTLAVLQSIIKGSEAISVRGKITERLEKLKELKTDLDKDKPTTPEFLSLTERIENCGAIDEQELQEFLAEMETEKSYQYNIPPFAKSPYLLKGLKGVQFLQKAFLSATTINKSFYDVLFSVMESVVSRLSEEELATALTTSTDHFNRVKTITRGFVTELKSALNREKSGMVFTARILLMGPERMWTELLHFLTKAKNKKGHDIRNPYFERSLGIKKICVDTLSDLPAPLYKILFGAERPFLLMKLFDAKSPFAPANFEIPVDLLMCSPVTCSPVFPLHRLLQMWLKKSDCFKHHFAKLLNCSSLRAAVERLKLEEIEETAQPLISCMAVVARLGEHHKNTKTSDILRTVRRKSRDEGPSELEWLAKYEHSDIVAEWVGLVKKRVESTDEPTFDPSALITEKDEEEVKVENTQKEGDETEEEEEEREMKAEEEDQTQSEDEGVDEIDQAPEDLADAVARGIVDQLADDAVTTEAEDVSSEKVPQDLVDGAVVKEENVSSEQVSQDLTGDAAVNEEDVAIDQMPLYPSAPASSVDEEEIYPDEQEGLLLHDEPVPEGEEQNEMEEEEEGEERLAATQSSTNSQEVDGFSRSIDQI